MGKNEFMEQLRIALFNEVPEQEIKNQLNYYNNYIASQSAYKKEEKVIEELGSPHLIAKTVIDAYKRSVGTTYNNRNNSYYKEQWDSSGYTSSRKSDSKFEDGSNSYNEKIYKGKSNKTSWYIKLVFILFIAVVFMLMFFIGSILLRLLLSLIPIILIFFIIFIILKSTKTWWKLFWYFNIKTSKNTRKGGSMRVFLRGV